MKKCSNKNCQETNPSFSPDKRNKSGLQSQCKKCISLAMSLFRENNLEYLIYQKDWKAKNKDRRREENRLYQKIYGKNRRKIDIQFKIAGNLRNRLNRIVNNKFKPGSTVKDLGCSIDFLIKYLESQFKKDWNWDNYGKIWEIDHIIPLSHFDLTNRQEFLKACYYTNLRPLEISKNRSENNRR